MELLPFVSCCGGIFERIVMTFICSLPESTRKLNEFVTQMPNLFSNLGSQSNSQTLTVSPQSQLSLRALFQSPFSNYWYLAMTLFWKDHMARVMKYYGNNMLVTWNWDADSGKATPYKVVLSQSGVSRFVCWPS